MERYRWMGGETKLIGDSLDGQTDRKQEGPKEISSYLYSFIICFPRAMINSR